MSRRPVSSLHIDYDPDQGCVSRRYQLVVEFNGTCYQSWLTMLLKMHFWTVFYQSRAERARAESEFNLKPLLVAIAAPASNFFDISHFLKRLRLNLGFYI